MAENNEEEAFKDAIENRLLNDSDENISRMQQEDFERCNSIEIIHDQFRDLMDEEEAFKDAIENAEGRF